MIESRNTTLIDTFIPNVNNFHPVDLEKIGCDGHTNMKSDRIVPLVSFEVQNPSNN